MKKTVLKVHLPTKQRLRQSTLVGTVASRQVGLGWVATQNHATTEPEGAWEHIAGHKITWTKATPFQVLLNQCMMSSQNPANLFTWGQLCQGRGSLEHILSCCSKALGDGRTCDDQVLRAIADTICTGINISKRQHPTKSTIAHNSKGLAAPGWD